MSYTQVDDWLFDTVMPNAAPNTYKVVSAVVRATWGWQLDSAPISLSEIQKMTGIKSRPTAKSALSDAIENGYIEHCGKHGQTFIYRPAVQKLNRQRFRNQTASGLEIKPLDVPTGLENKPPAVQKLNRQRFRNQTASGLEIKPPSLYKERSNKGKERSEKESPISEPQFDGFDDYDENERPIAKALTKVTGVDPSLFFQPKQTINFQQAVNRLLKASVTADEIVNNFSGENSYWFQASFGRKNNRLPHVGNVLGEIGAARQWQPSTPSTGGEKSTKHQRSSAAIDQAFAELSQQGVNA